MLRQFTIQNFGLIERLSVEFDPRLNILTGETGAGKSILIGALRVLLGERVTPSQFRDEARPCALEGEFDLSKTEVAGLECLKDYLLEDDTALVIQRICQPDGRSKIKINGLTVTSAQLKEIGNYLMDFHGPHDHQLLLDESLHVSMLDRLAALGKAWENYEGVYRQYAEARRAINEIEGLKQSRERDLDLLSHQVRELEQVPLDEDRCHELMLEQAKIKNAEKLHEYLHEALDGLDGDSGGSSEAIRKAFHPINRLAQLDESAARFTDKLAEAQALHDELIIELRDYAAGLSFEPSQAEDIRRQCDLYDDIRRKYGPTLAEAQAFYTQAKTRLDLLKDLEHNDAEACSRLQELEKKLTAAGAEITKLRKKAAAALKKTIEKELTELGIKHVRFEAQVKPGGFRPDGCDEVAFYLSPNAGEDLKPLADIVSSGEAARVMLALKKALIKADPVPVLVFDEIDAQIGGRLGAITGEKLRDISRARQVLLITHLPQIASFADRHFKITKTVKSGRAVTEVALLGKQERVDELAQMMSGEKTSDISLKHATDMLAKASK